MQGIGQQLDRVGGRQLDPDLPGRGGGYLDSCRGSTSFLEPALADPRLGELRELGIGERWIRIAGRIGVDAFLMLWQILDEENSDLPAGERESVRVRVPLYASWLRLQRNKYIRTLAEEGRRPAEIRQVLLRERLCESITERHISRIIADERTDIE